jgi:hypothetical protein
MGRGWWRLPEGSPSRMSTRPRTRLEVEGVEPVRRPGAERWSKSLRTRLASRQRRRGRRDLVEELDAVHHAATARRALVIALRRLPSRKEGQRAALLEDPAGGACEVAMAPADAVA